MLSIFEMYQADSRNGIATPTPKIIMIAAPM